VIKISSYFPFLEQALAIAIILIVVTFMIAILYHIGAFRALGKIKIKRAKPKKEEEPKKEEIKFWFPHKIKGVIVLEKYGDIIRSAKAVKYDGREIVTNTRHVYIVPTHYRPMILWRKTILGKRAYLVFFANAETGELINVRDITGAQGVGYDPEFLYNLLNTRILEKLTAITITRFGEVLQWLMAGLGIAFLIIFIVFPALGIPINIGKQPINVYPQIKVQIPTHSVPPPTTYTLPAGGG